MESNNILIKSTGVIGDTVNEVVQTTTCGYPLNLINFDEDNPVNIYTIVNYPNIETEQQYELLTQEIDHGIIESIERVKGIQPDILHIIIGGNCTSGNEYDYYPECDASREVTRNYS